MAALHSHSPFLPHICPYRCRALHPDRLPKQRDQTQINRAFPRLPKPDWISNNQSSSHGHGSKSGAAGATFPERSETSSPLLALFFHPFPSTAFPIFFRPNQFNKTNRWIRIGWLLGLVTPLVGTVPPASDDLSDSRWDVRFLYLYIFFLDISDTSQG